MILSAPIRFGIDPLAWEIIPRIHIGPLAISPHGLGVALGFYLGARFMARRARDQGGPDEAHIWNLAFWLLIGSMVGARLAYVLGHFSEVTDGGDDLLGVLKVWEGGISLLGGMTGAVLAGIPYVRKHRLGFWRMADLAAPSLMLGIGVGRIGDLLIGDHIGKPTNFALGWRCLGESGGVDPQPAAVYMRALERGEPPALGCYDLVLHQTALYDFVSAWLLFGVLIWLGRRVKRRGVLALTFVVWYAAVRVITDFLRVDKTYLGLTGSQIWALVVGVVCAYILSRYRGAPPEYAEPPATPNAESSQISSRKLDSDPG